jgi:hypothetical protein
MRNKALSTFVSFALTILIGVTAVTLSLTVLNPALNKARDSAIIDEAFNNLDILDNNIKEVASESQESRRKVNIKVTEGTYRVDSLKDFLNFTYNMKENLEISGQRGNINITISGNDITLFIKYTNLDLQGSVHFTKGDNSIVILNNGTNATTNYPIIYVGS